MKSVKDIKERIKNKTYERDEREKYRDEAENNNIYDMQSGELIRLHGELMSLEWVINQ